MTGNPIKELVIREPLKAEHVLQLIHRKRLAGKAPEQILETVETWLYNVVVAGGIIVGDTSISSELEADTGQRTEEVP